MRMIDVSVAEAKKLAAIQLLVNKRYEGKPKDIGIMMALKAELKERIHDAGFECVIDVKSNEYGYWMPVVEITGRTDKALQGIVNNEGIDLEQRIFEAKRETSQDLKTQGVDTDLLLG